MPEQAKPSRRRTTKTETTTEKRTPRARKPKAAAVADPPSDAIAFHAYLLWEQGEPGDASEHWLRAERELAAA